MAEHFFHFFLGFGGAWGLIFLDKGLMARLLQRDPNYDQDGEEETDAV